MYVRKPIKLEELQKRGWEDACLDYMIECAIKRGRKEVARIKAAEVILQAMEGLEIKLEPREVIAIMQRIHAVEDQPASEEKCG